MINHSTDNVTEQENEPKVVQVREWHRPRLHKKINWGGVSKRRFAEHYIKSRQGAIHWDVIGWRGGRVFCGSQCIDAMGYLDRHTVLTVHTRILSISVTGKNKLVIYLIIWSCTHLSHSSCTWKIMTAVGNTTWKVLRIGLWALAIPTWPCHGLLAKMVTSFPTAGCWTWL